MKTYRIQIQSAVIDIRGENFRDALGRLILKFPNVARFVIRRVLA